MKNKLKKYEQVYIEFRQFFDDNALNKRLDSKPDMHKFMELYDLKANRQEL